MTWHDIGIAVLEGLGVAAVIIALVAWGLKAQQSIQENEYKCENPTPPGYRPPVGTFDRGPEMESEGDSCIK